MTYVLDANSLEREINGMMNAKRTIPDIERLMILTHEETRVVDIGGQEIKIVPLWKWRLSPFS